MPIGDIAGEVLGGVLRFVGNLIIDFVPELLLRAPGYLLCKPFKKDIDPDGALVNFRKRAPIPLHKTRI